MSRRGSAVFIGLVALAAAQQFSDATIAQVKQNLADVAMMSWELGTRAQALLELDAPEYSVYNEGSIPPPSNGNISAISDVLSIASNIVNALPGPGIQPLDSGAAGDPPSLGVAVLLANATGTKNPQAKVGFGDAATGQLEYLFNDVPRSPDGAISHHNETLWLWADFIYMTPPFMAYFGALTGNTTLMEMAYTQCSLYRGYLHDSTNMWEHTALNPSADDTGHWSTGNGWAANGMLRVLATMANSPYSGQFKNEMGDLENWVTEILDGTYAYLNQNTLLFNNYPDQPQTFQDASGTTLIAAATYRLSLLRGVHHHLPDAERVRKGLVSHVDSDGWLNPVVNPEDYSLEGSHSPEGQGFVLLLHSAWRDWVADGSQGANAALPRAVIGRALATLAVLGVLAALY